MKTVHKVDVSILNLARLKGSFWIKTEINITPFDKELQPHCPTKLRPNTNPKNVYFQKCFDTCSSLPHHLKI